MVYLLKERDNIKVGTKCDLEIDTQTSKFTLSADISNDFKILISGHNYTGDPIRVNKSKIWLKLDYKYNEPVPNG